MAALLLRSGGFFCLLLVSCPYCTRSLSSSSTRRRWQRGSPKKRRVVVEKEDDGFDAGFFCRAQIANDLAPEAIVVPESCRGSLAHGPRFRYASLDDIFPGLGEAFSNFEFRDTLRIAGRRDLSRNAVLTEDKASSIQGSWQDKAPTLTQALKAAGPNAPCGEEFLQGIAALRLESISHATTHTGHWMDIVGIRNRKLHHAWHQDAAGDYKQLTVMLGFPVHDHHSDENTPGVFSHLAPLSHTFLLDASSLPHNKKKESTFSKTVGGPLHLEPQDLGLDSVAETSIVRPVFKRGQEILLYHDASTIHSAPDVAHREALWRFM